MDKYRELLSLVEEIIENTTNVSVEKLEEIADTSYSNNDINGNQYDRIKRLIVELL